MKHPSNQVFRSTYRATVADVLPHVTPAVQQELARHNAGWAKDATDFGRYLEASEERFARAFDLVRSRPSAASVCDIGGLWGLWAVTLSRLGYGAAMTEALVYYGDAFDGLFDFIVGEGVTIHDTDPYEDDLRPVGQFDVVSLLAVLEHYPHSHRQVLTQARNLTATGGVLLVEVPNIAYLPRRIALARGRSPLPDVGTIWSSAVPFTGHHHEFTVDEVQRLADLAGWTVTHLELFDYSPEPATVKQLLRYPLDLALPRWASRRYPNTRETILAAWEPRSIP